MSVPLEEVPAVAATAWVRLRDELRRILGGDLVALWGEGSTVHPDRRRILSTDLDTKAVVQHVVDDQLGEQLNQALEPIAQESGIEWDIGYILASDVGGSELARDARCARHHKRNTMWAVERAHWLAGGYVHLHGATPEQLVVPPTWSELEYALGRELEHLERHVLEGHDDLYEATCALFDGSRILHAFETHNTALSKRAGGMWALEHLPQRWHAALRAANRAYDGEASEEDAELLRVSIAPFVEMVRERVPQLEDREPGSLPRWS